VGAEVRPFFEGGIRSGDIPPEVVFSVISHRIVSSWTTCKFRPKLHRLCFRSHESSGIEFVECERVSLAD